ncbi:hypothetical protein [Bacillus sp. X1(2014)]|uniref:hypothetical protein n=1 Tax=Bacillus sp. X1(2014) TaxID=1565991 RepID=UPI0011A3E3E4|nr:hypothetical protein [Bacillus sp. X1(2014)]
MVFTFYFVLSWVMMGLLIFNRQEKRGSRKEIIFLVLLTCLINTHNYLGLFETFKWMKTTTTPKLYLAFLLFRSVFSPLLVSYLILYINNSTLKKQIILVFLYCLLIIGIDKVNLINDLYDFKKWNQFYTVIYYLLYLFFTMFAFNWFRGLHEQGVKSGDDVCRK